MSATLDQTKDILARAESASIHHSDDELYNSDSSNLSEGIYSTNIIGNEDLSAYFVSSNESAALQSEGSNTPDNSSCVSSCSTDNKSLISTNMTAVSPTLSAYGNNSRLRTYSNSGLSAKNKTKTKKMTRQRRAIIQERKRQRLIEAQQQSQPCFGHGFHMSDIK